MTCVDAQVTAETRGRWTAGMTVTDFDGGLGTPGIEVATTLDRDGFWDLMLDALASGGPAGS